MAVQEQKVVSDQCQGAPGGSHGAVGIHRVYGGVAQSGQFPGT